MRAIRAVALAALVVLDVTPAAAQSTRHFKDSWFWGVKAGGMIYQVQSDPNGGLAPLGGIDWLITRTNGGLYVSLDQAFFNQYVLVNDSINPIDVTPGGRQVSLKSMRRFTVAGMLFPMQTYRLHPYFGVGMTLNHIAKAEAAGTFVNNTQQALVLGTIENLRTSAAPVFIFGAQLRLLKISTFGQLTATPANSNFFLWTGSNWRAALEGGFRWNVGTAIDQMR